MPIERLTPERRRELTRAALIDAATELFAQRGFHDTSLEEIADSAGFTRGAIYSNFKNKEDLLLAVIDRYNELLIHAFSEALERASSRSHDDVVKLAASLWSELVHRDPNLTLLGLELQLYALRNPPFRRRLNEFNREHRKSTATLIETQARQQGLPLKIDGEDLADILWSTTNGILYYAALDAENPERWDRLIEIYFGIIEDSLQLAPPAAGPEKR